MVYEEKKIMVYDDCHARKIYGHLSNKFYEHEKGERKDCKMGSYVLIGFRNTSYIM